MNLSKKQLDYIKKQYRLTNRETQILELILQGIQSNAKIANELGLSEGTIKQYNRVLYAKFQASSKLEIAIKVLSPGNN
ncbi:MAG: response regulator transcription factor [Planctomycetota bacterium]|jgi:DNA-binding NarL/FixJ family response regulator